MEDCIFCKIIKGDIPSQKVYEDDKTFAFLDINPISKGHTLVIPKKHSIDLLVADAEDLNAIISTCQKIADACMKGLKADGISLDVSTKPAAGQVVMHTHFHIIPRWKDDGLKHWPGHKLSESEMKDIQDKIKNSL